MTERIEDLPAWLDRAISKREEAARSAQATDPAPWTADTSTSPTRDHNIEDGSGLLVAANGEALWDYEGASVLCMTAAASIHIALHDPEAVLRRCAADRKLLALHNVPAEVFPEGWYLDDNRWCVNCGFGNAGEPIVDDINDCPTLNALAEGYGFRTA
ncbi:DUF6221 family protein [Streptomyces sp. NPDC048611]|uniref:DUF6221 family protein n=1 Tax=Streptomyces sp. NPDC048611 TaxID=3155635 RepID=UPI00343DF139